MKHLRIALPVLLTLLVFIYACKDNDDTPVTNSEVSWQVMPVPFLPPFNPQGISHDITSLTVAANGLLVVQITNSYDTIFVSSDGGTTWTVSAMPSNPYPLDNGEPAIVSPTGILYAVYSNVTTVNNISTLTAPSEIFRSNDNGATWQQVQAPAGGNDYFTAVAFDNSGGFYEAGSKGVYYSSDNSNSWTTILVPHAGETFNSIFAAGNKTILCNSFQRGMQRTTDNGITWNSVTSGLPSLTDSSEFVPSFYQPIANGKIYLHLEGTNPNIGNDIYPGILISSDDGATWKHIVYGLPDVFNVQGMYSNGNNIFMSFENGSGWFPSYESSDGVTWTSVSLNPPISTGGTQIFAGFDPQHYMYAYSDYNVYKTTKPIN